METLGLVGRNPDDAVRGDVRVLQGRALGLDVNTSATDFGVLELPDGATVEVFGSTSPYNAHLTHPVAGFLVSDLNEAVTELQAAGAEIVLPVQHGGPRKWMHFARPTGSCMSSSRTHPDDRSHVALRGHTGAGTSVPGAPRALRLPGARRDQLPPRRVCAPAQHRRACDLPRHHPLGLAGCRACVRRRAPRMQPSEARRSIGGYRAIAWVRESWTLCASSTSKTRPGQS
jgi:hypothetical protein